MIIVDRIENDIVVLEIENRFYELPKFVFPETIKEGDVVSFVIDEETTSARKESLTNRLTNLFNKGER